MGAKLFIVAKGNVATFESLRRSVGNEPDVAIIYDRRAPSLPGPVSAERSFWGPLRQKQGSMPPGPIPDRRRQIHVIGDIQRKGWAVVRSEDTHDDRDRAPSVPVQVPPPQAPPSSPPPPSGEPRLPRGASETPKPTRGEAEAKVPTAPGVRPVAPPPPLPRRAREPDPIKSAPLSKELPSKEIVGKEITAARQRAEVRRQPQPRNDGKGARPANRLPADPPESAAPIIDLPVARDTIKRVMLGVLGVVLLLLVIASVIILALF